MGEPSTIPERDDDPDAPWRRGFEGWTTTEDADASPVDEQARPAGPYSRRSPTDSGREQTVVHESDPRSSSRRRRVVVLSLIVVLALGAAGALAATVFRSDGSPAARTAPLVAESAEPAWVRSIDGAIDDVGVGAETVVVAAAGTVEALEAASGELRWSAPVDVDVDRVTVVDGQVVVEGRTDRGRALVVVHDGLTGDEVWNSADEVGVVSVSGGDDDALLFRRTQADGDAVLEVLDPTTGSVVGDPLTLSGVTASGSDLAVALTDRTVAIWSRAELEVVTGEVGAFNLRMAAPFDGRVVSLDREGRLILFDEDGRRVDETPVVAADSGGSSGPMQLAGVVDDEPIAVVSAGSTIGYSIADDSIEIAWERFGTTGTPVSTEDGPFAVLVGPLDTIETRTMIIDPVTGRTVAVADAAGSPERPPILGHNAFVLAPTIGAPERVLAAYDYDGDQLWSTVVPAGAGYEVAHGVVVVAQTGAEGSRVSLAR